MGARARKEKEMENMTDKQMDTMLKMILEILNGCKTIEEAQDKIKALLTK